MILLNGNPATAIDALDRGLHYGDGLFETLAVVNGNPLLWERHMSRLDEGCMRLGIQPIDPATLRKESATVLEGADLAVLKIVITRGPGGRGYKPPAAPAPTRLLLAAQWPEYPGDYQRTGVTVRLCQTPLARNPLLSGLKHLNRLEQVLARGEWGEEFAEGLMCDTQGNLVEGTMSNLFVVRGGELLTPEIAECGVRGIMRGQVMDCARRLGIRTRETSLSVEDVRRAEALFLTNSLIGIWPVRQWDERVFPPNALIRTILEQLKRDQACV